MPLVLPTSLRRSGRGTKPDMVAGTRRVPSLFVAQTGKFVPHPLVRARSLSPYTTHSHIGRGNPAPTKNNRFLP